MASSTTRLWMALVLVTLLAPSLAAGDGSRRPPSSDFGRRRSVPELDPAAAGAVAAALGAGAVLLARRKR